MVVRAGKTLATPYIGSLRAFRKLSANYFHYWKLIEWAVESGLWRVEGSSVAMAMEDQGECLGEDGVVRE